MTAIRPPAERLAGCCWLPRFVDKTRAYLAGELTLPYRLAYGSIVGVDGYFLRHFRIARRDLIRSIRASEDDAGVTSWFLAQPYVNRETIASWNQCAPELGAPGKPGRAVYLAVRWFLYPKEFRNPSKNMFAAIERDEA